ncbi:electron transfer flavoprotein subunit beta/FixA family protein [Halanaeroarchaeum sp. HSR-CO]|uniref:electron transfer flavoprotein subunit beta/FixA family protein n=1 Tax=Halanaeroarchaeum sp. HSR-CO TaxID=2866382 RepID=UPI00217DD49A|nr:electron transfer flavoprotein subunit beta/FixA family protein [Halanaeroarchaeum sp. HSR-CO]
MKILVTVKEIAEVADDFQIADNEIEETYLEYDLNEWDDYAVEEGVQLVEEGLADEVVAATIGPERAEETIRMALAKGADRAVRVWDDALEAQDLLDVETKADIFAAIVEEEQPDIVLTGVQANDDSFGATGVALAERIDYEWAAVVNNLDLDLDEGVAHVRRELEGGLEELTDVDVPAVFTIQTGINEPRYASLRGIRQAQSKEIAPKTLADLGLEESDADSVLQVAEMFEPEAEGEAEFLEGDAGDQAGQLADVLADVGVLGE